ncbi:MAG: hypothetical protein GX952_04130 [Firmicutes bacterium]|nr:hypothetical protein [Bacillota bacterium]
MIAGEAEKTYLELMELFGSRAQAARCDTISQRLKKVRDLTLVRVAGPNYLVIACDSDGGIGPKVHDTVYTTGYWLGRLAARVPLMEVMASGAAPLLVLNALSVELEPTGKSIIAGVRAEAAAAGLTDPAAVSGSTEENVPTVATGVGVTVIGVGQEALLKPGTGRAFELVAAVGVPKSAPADDVTSSDRDIADLSTVRSLLGLSFIGDILPVGSKGIAYEARQMAMAAGLNLLLDQGCPLDVNKSAGPSTCVLVSLPENCLPQLAAAVDKPVAPVGQLVP